MARLVAVAGAVVLLVVAAVPLSSGLPDPRQNDAGYGIDAPGFKLAALPLEPGTYQGNVTSYSDLVDQFRLDPPPRTVVRVRLQAEILDPPWPDVAAMARLETRMGRIIEEEGLYLGNGTWQWSLTAGAGHRVNLTIETHAPQEAGELIPYMFTVIYDRYDHARLLDGGDRNASAWRIRVPEGVPARFEGFNWGGAPKFGGDDVQQFSHTVIRSPEDCRWWRGSSKWWQWPVPGPAGSRSGVDGDSVVWTHGTPQDVHAGGPDLRPGVSKIAPMLFPVSIERPAGNFTVLYGHAASVPLWPLGWVVWDGPVAPEIEPLYARARFATLEEFDDGGGQAVQVGPYVTAENVSLSWTVPDRKEQTVHLGVDGGTPKQDDIQTGRDDTRMQVEKPDGATVRLVDDWRAWATGGDTYWRAQAPVQSGTWRVTAEHVDGVEGDEIRANLIEFGFDPGCPEDEEPAGASGASGATGGGGSSEAVSPCGLLCDASMFVERILEPVQEVLP